MRCNQRNRNLQEMIKCNLKNLVYKVEPQGLEKEKKKLSFHVDKKIINYYNLKQTIMINQNQNKLIIIIAIMRIYDIFYATKVCATIRVHNKNNNKNDDEDNASRSFN